MKAVCVDQHRRLGFCEIAPPGVPPPGQVNVRIDAAAINPGDKMFLRVPRPSAPARQLDEPDVWGASAAGVIVDSALDVPAHYLGRKVAVYRALQSDKPSLGLWCETAQVPYQACLLLPESAETKAYSGSLVNVVTAYAFIEEAAAAGHRAIVVTAGGSATGQALTSLARRRGMPTIVVARNAASRSRIEQSGSPYVLASDDAEFVQNLAALSVELGATAVFDGVGGQLLTQIAPSMPHRTTVYCYGFLAGPEAVTITTSSLALRDLTIRRFVNSDNLTVRSPQNLSRMLADLEHCISDPLLQTRVGRQFSLEDFDQAMAFEDNSGGKAVLVP